MQHFIRFAAVLAFGALTLPGTAQRSPQPMTVQPVRGGVYFVQGGAGSNATFVVGTTGVIVVDAKMTADSAKEMLADIAKFTSKPVTTVILTHSDLDHVGGLAGFPKGLTIIAQANCKKEMQESLTSPRPAPKDYMPTRTVGMKEDTTIDGVHVQMFHFAPAHTSGDLIVYFPQQQVVATGDIVATQVPVAIIHLEKHGSSEGWITTMKGILALHATTFIPGHGDLQTRTEIQQRLTKGETERATIKRLVAQGKSLDQIKQALGEPTAEPAGGMRFPTFTEIVYQELTKKKT